MANIPTFDELMKGFGVVTVMNACIYESVDGYNNTLDCCKIGQVGEAFTPDKWKKTDCHIDTLKIANITQEGPTKTITGGQYANPLIKYGKTATMEMQDALGRASTMEKFFGCKYDAVKGRLSITDKFPGPFAIEGTTFFIDQKTGEKVYVYVFIPQFIPDAILTLTQDAEGDATVFDLNGNVSVTKVADDSTDEARDIFYEIRAESFFLEGAVTALESDETVEDAALRNAKSEAIDNLKGYASLKNVSSTPDMIDDVINASTSVEDLQTKIATVISRIDQAANS